MFYRVKKQTRENYPNPVIYCSVVCFLNLADMNDETLAVYWIPFTQDIRSFVDKTESEINDILQARGSVIFNLPENQLIFQAIETPVIYPEML